MTLLDFEELTTYWAEHPPVHILVAAYLGLGKAKRTRMPSGPPGEAASGPGGRVAPDVGSILAELGSGFNSRDVHDGLTPVVLNFNELRRRASVPAD